MNLSLPSVLYLSKINTCHVTSIYDVLVLWIILVSSKKLSQKTVTKTPGPIITKGINTAIPQLSFHSESNIIKPSSAFSKVRLTGPFPINISRLFIISINLPSNDWMARMLLITWCPCLFLSNGIYLVLLEGLRQYWGL